MTGSPGFGPALRNYRQLAALSQQVLAERAEVSARHVSFLETGKSAPSRQMVLLLGNALDLPLRERNVLLACAGFAPVYQESALSDERMAEVRRALQFILRQHEPYGATVVNRRYDVLDLNQGAARMLGAFIADPQDPTIVGNAIHAFFHPNGLRPFVVDWEVAAGILMDRLHLEGRGPGGAEVRQLIDEVMAYPGLPERFTRVDVHSAPDPFLALELQRDQTRIRVFGMICALGTPNDITAQELRIETYFPADEATDAYLRSLMD